MAVFAPQIQIWIAQKGKKDIPINKDRIMSGRFSEKVRGSAELTVDLNNSDGAMWYAAPLLTKNTRLKFSFGYPGKMRGPIELTNSGIPEGSHTLTIKARIRNRKRRESSDGKLSRSWDNVSVTEVVELVASEMGYTGRDFHVDFDFEKQEQITQSNETNLELLHRLADMNGYHFWIDETGFHFQIPATDTKPAAVFKKVEAFIGPGVIVDYELPKTPKRIPRKVTLHGMNPFTGKVIKSTVNATDSTMPKLSGNDVTSDGEETEYVGRAFSFTDASAAKETLGIMRETKLSAVKLKLKVYGEPYVKPGLVVQVDRLADPLDGIWYVWETDQEIGNGFYTELLLGREGFKKKSTKKKDKTDDQSLSPTVGNVWSGVNKQWREYIGG